MAVDPALGLRAARRGRDRLELAAGALSAVWIALVAAYAAGRFLGDEAGTEGGGLTGLLLVIAAAAPVLLFAFAALIARRAEALREAAEALRAGVESGRRDEVGSDTRLERRLAALEAKLDAALAGAAPAGAGPKATGARPAPAPRQPDLPFSEQAPETSAPIAWVDVARALDFPRDERDAEGFAALQAALADAEFRALLQAAEDVLAILAAEGVHMEDLPPEPAPLDAWAAYAEGARGAKAEAVGGVRDPEAVDRVRERARRDPVFRDAGLVLTRRWNGLVARVFRELGRDPVMLRLADTRTGRAFMLLARALGAFDRGGATAPPRGAEGEPGHAASEG